MQSITTYPPPTSTGFQDFHLIPSVYASIVAMDSVFNINTSFVLSCDTTYLTFGFSFQGVIKSTVNAYSLPPKALHYMTIITLQLKMFKLELNKEISLEKSTRLDVP